jgi:hypothetical protein
MAPSAATVHATLAVLWRCPAIPSDEMPCHAMPCHAMRCDAMRCDAMRCDAASRASQGGPHPCHCGVFREVEGRPSREARAGVGGQAAGGGEAHGRPRLECVIPPPLVVLSHAPPSPRPVIPSRAAYSPPRSLTLHLALFSFLLLLLRCLLLLLVLIDPDAALRCLLPYLCTMCSLVCAPSCTHHLMAVRRCLPCARPHQTF